jgi:hypothetical protein
MLRNARFAAQHILKKEAITGGVFAFLSDLKGQEGDVRDLVVTFQEREIGLSCKNNHMAYKHSRLSDSIDFVKKWGLHPDGASLAYRSEIQALFSELRLIKEKSNGQALWREQENIAEKYYWPLLNAFEDEIRRIETEEMCHHLVEYLIGKYDFYKIISKPRKVLIYGFNIQKSLKTSVIKLPDKILNIRNKNGSQYSKTITLNAGWEFNFRIHNASSKIEPRFQSPHDASPWRIV